MLQKSRLGNTSLWISPLGLGTVKFGRNTQVKYPTSFNLPHDEDILTLLDYAESSGINLLDTAPAYGESEARLGKLLTDREKWVLCTKTGEEFINGKSHFDFSSTHTTKSIERSLKRLKTDYLDIVLVHSNGEDKKIIEETDVLSTLSEMKQAGKIRAFGMSTKTVEGGLRALDASDLVMVTYNLIERNDQEVIAYAHENNKGIFIKKALASGHLQKIASEDPVRRTMDFIFKEKGVSSVIVGTLNKGHLADNVECVEGVVERGGF